MDEKLVKFVVGLALESAMVNKRATQTLIDLYAEPDLERIRALRDRLIVSEDQYEREVAIWLEPTLRLGPLKSDPRGLVVEMKEMEFILYVLIPKSGEAQRDVNDWLNYIANAAQSIEDGFWIDAKILLSWALQCSRRPSVEALKTNPSLRYEVDVLQKATASYFEEVKGYPLRLRILEERVDTILEVQNMMLELMHIHYGERNRDSIDTTRTPIRRMSSTIRYLMDGNKELDASKRELLLASGYLEKKLKEIVDQERRKMMGGYNKRIKDIINNL